MCYDNLLFAHLPSLYAHLFIIGAGCIWIAKIAPRFKLSFMMWSKVSTSFCMSVMFLHYLCSSEFSLSTSARAYFLHCVALHELLNPLMQICFLFRMTTSKTWRRTRVLMKVSQKNKDFCCTHTWEGHFRMDVCFHEVLCVFHLQPECTVLYYAETA